MGVGKVGGKKGGASGPKGTGVGGVGKTAGAGFASRVERKEAVKGASGVASSAQVQSVDPVTAPALEIVRQLRAGNIKSKEDATKRLVAEVLRQKVRMQSRALTQRIADTLQDDPRLNQALERLWGRGE